MPIEQVDPGVFEVYPSIRPAGVYRWRLVFPSGDVTLTSGTTFGTSVDAMADATRAREAATSAPVRVLSSPHPVEAGTSS